MGFFYRKSGIRKFGPYWITTTVSNAGVSVTHSIHLGLYTYYINGRNAGQHKFKLIPGGGWKTKTSKQRGTHRARQTRYNTEDPDRAGRRFAIKFGQVTVAGFCILAALKFLL